MDSQRKFHKGDGSVTFSLGEFVEALEIKTGRWLLGKITEGFVSYSGDLTLFVKIFDLKQIRRLDEGQVRKVSKETIRQFLEKR